MCSPVRFTGRHLIVVLDLLAIAAALRLRLSWGADLVAIGTFVLEVVDRIR
jgi:hypothetical protein